MAAIVYLDSIVSCLESADIYLLAVDPDGEIFGTELVETLTSSQSEIFTKIASRKASAVDLVLDYIRIGDIGKLVIRAKCLIPNGYNPSQLTILRNIVTSRPNKYTHITPQVADILYGQEGTPNENKCDIYISGDPAKPLVEFIEKIFSNWDGNIFFYKPTKELPNEPRKGKGVRTAPK